MADAGASGDAAAVPDGELITPEVPAALLTALLEIGFSVERATRALYHTGTDTAEVAVNWIMEHEGDADIDAPLLVPKNKIVRFALAFAVTLHMR
jgi:ubiquitin carboxyl-terminal hydrolase 5/13